MACRAAEWQAERAAKRRAAGLCLRCPGMAVEGQDYCVSCREAKNKRSAARQQRIRSARKAVGQCDRCAEAALPGEIRCARCRDEHREKSKAHHRKQRNIALLHYGGVCACCGEDDLRFLSIDHTNGGGIKHRKEVGTKSGHRFSAWLIKNNFPPGFQVLRMNCNCAKSWEKECPHKSDKRDPNKLFKAFGLLSAV